nr:MAG TPA: anaerobic ribonucleoside triphosphate reductase [Bacteriophage sp.]
MTYVIKRGGSKAKWDSNKIVNAIRKAFESCKEENKFNENEFKEFAKNFTTDNINTESIQDAVEYYLMGNYPNIAKSYILYREKHKEARARIKRLHYMEEYKNNQENAATSSNTDPNANTAIKNVASLEAEVYKDENRLIQRQRMKDKLNELFPELAKQYEKDLNSHIIYTHDEASTPVPKFYCMAVSLYPLMSEGVGNIDGVTPTSPNDLESFSGQLTNLIFTLSSQCKGAVAVGSYFVALNYYTIMEFGDKWYDKLDLCATSPYIKIQRTVRDRIYKAFSQFVWGINQPAGNRSYQSPFTNISYFDKTYFEAMFGEFYYPDGTKPEWKAVDVLQRLFMKWFNKLRTKAIVAFPVETFAMVHNGKDIIDKKYKDLCAEMYAEGHSFFTYISDSADSLASCCRLRNKVDKNTFSPTSGLTGIMTGSCNVITLNINRIIQDCFKNIIHPDDYNKLEINACWKNKYGKENVKHYLENILDRVYKYHIAYKTILYDWEDAGMFTCCNAGYIHIKKLYSTIGINGLNEAAEFLGLEVNNNEEYIEFLQLILSTIKEQNAKYSINDKKRPFLFNSEVVPAESLSSKNYNWDKKDGYEVPSNRNLYNSYFFLQNDNNISVLDKMYLHGNSTYQYTDGGSACHINLEEHLSKEQYLKLIDYAIREGTSYFTFNIPNSKCEDCGYITKHPIVECPKCHSKNISQYTRIIG